MSTNQWRAIQWLVTLQVYITSSQLLIFHLIPSEKHTLPYHAKNKLWRDMTTVPRNVSSMYDFCEADLKTQNFMKNV